MKQDQQESHLSETPSDESSLAEKALASESWVFWALVGRWGFIGTAVLYWLGVVEFSPLDLVEWIVNLAYGASPSPENTPQLMVFIRESFAGFSWAVLVYPWLSYVRYRVGVIEAGSKEAYHQRRREIAERSSTPALAGTLVGVSLVKGGVLSPSETLVETSEGFFRVSGLVNTVKKGEPVFTLGGQLWIGAGTGQKRYTVIS